MHAITRRVGTTVAILLAAVLGTASRAAADEPGWAEGQWIGGFEGVDGTVYVSAQVEAEAGVLTGSLELPLQGDGAVKLDAVKATADALRFDVRGAKTRLAFEGHRREAGRVTGTVRQGRGAASFELLKVATLPADRLDAIAGTYELEPGHHVLVARSQGGLIYVDQDRGRVGALFALDDRTLIGGPSLGSGYPIELKIEVPARARRGRRPHQVVVARAGHGARRSPPSVPGRDGRLRERRRPPVRHAAGARPPGPAPRGGDDPRLRRRHPRRAVAVGRHVRARRHRRADPRQAGNRRSRPAAGRRRRSTTWPTTPTPRCGCCRRGPGSTRAGSGCTA